MRIVNCCWSRLFPLLLGLCFLRNFFFVIRNYNRLRVLDYVLAVFSSLKLVVPIFGWLLWCGVFEDWRWSKTSIEGIAEIRNSSFTSSNVRIFRRRMAFWASVWFLVMSVSCVWSSCNRHRAQSWCRRISVMKKLLFTDFQQKGTFASPYNRILQEEVVIGVLSLCWAFFGVWFEWHAAQCLPHLPCT